MFRSRVVSESGEGKLEAVYATKPLRLLENSKEMFLVEEDRFALQMWFVPTKVWKNPDTRG